MLKFYVHIKTSFHLRYFLICSNKPREISKDNEENTHDNLQCRNATIY